MNEHPQPVSAPLRFALYSSSLGNYFFHEIRDLIAAGLRELGHAVELRDEKKGFGGNADWHLVVAPHEFFVLGKGEALADRPLPENTVIFNTEQPSTKWFELAARHFPRAAAIWDIDFESSLRITRDGHPCSYLPLGHADGFAMFQPAPELPLHQETQRLPADVRQGDFFGRPLAARPLDLLFLGHASARRENFFARHGARLAPFRNYLYRPSVMRPLIPGETTNMNTLTSIGLAQRSKILLNVHHGVDKYFEWHRIVLLGIAQRTLVLTEPCSLAPPFRANVDFVEAPLEALAARAEHYLRSESGRREAQAIVERGYETLTRRCRISDMLRPLVGALREDSRLNCASVSHIVSPATPPPSNPDPLSICVVTPDVAGEPWYADVGTSQAALAEQFAAQGHRVTLLHTKNQFGAGRSQGYWSVHFAARNIQYAAVPADLDVSVHGSEAAARSYETYLWLQKRAFDVVHLPETEGIGMYSLLARSQGLAFAGARFCLNAAGPRVWRRQASELFVTSPYDLELDFMERECFRLADALVTPTEFMSGWLERQNWTLPAQRTVRPDRIEAAPRPDTAAAAPVRTLAYAGLLERSTELELFCQAVERLEKTALKGVRIEFHLKRKELAAVNGADYVRRRLRNWTLPWQVREYGAPGELFQLLAEPGCLAVITAPRDNSPWLVRGCLEHGARFLATREGGVPELISPEDHAAALFTPKAPALAARLEEAIRRGAIAPRTAPNRDERIAAWFAAHTIWAKQPPAEAAGGGEISAFSPQPSALPFVSVCLVHFNRPEYLQQALASLRAQDYTNFEVVLVDDGSTKPEAVQFLKGLEPEFARRGWRIVRQENRYLGAARNTAAREARGEYLVFMDDDNVAKPHELSTFVRVARRTGADMLTCAMDVFTGPAAPGPGTRARVRWVFLGGAAATGAIRNCFGDANGCIRREAFWRVGGFTEDHGITHEDWEFYARAVLQGCRMETMPEALFWYRTAAGSMIHSTPIHANLQRSLRPYLAALPEPLGGLMHLIQGSTCAQSSWAVSVPDYHDLLELHQSLLSAGRELNRLGRKREAEALFLKVLHSSETIGHAPLQLRAQMSAAVVLAHSGGQGMAKALLERAAKLAGVTQDQVAAEEVRLLQETLASGGNLDEAAARIKLFETGAGHDQSETVPGVPATQAVENQDEPCPPNTVQSPESTAHSLSPNPQSAIRNPQSPLTSIIILAMNQIEHTRLCLESIAAHTPQPHELIIVDNGSTDGTPGFLKQWQAAHANCTVIRNAANRGFSAGNNQGLAVARGDYALLLNNDTVVTDGWLGNLLGVFERHPDTGVVGPVTNNISGPQQVPQTGYTDLSGLPAFAAKLTGANPGQSAEVNRVVGFCLLARRAVIERIGGLDERFGSGNFEDDDFCIRARLAGFRIRVATDSFVHHTGSATFKGEKIDFRQAMRRNWDYFVAKWRFGSEATPERGYPNPEALPEGVQIKVPLPALHTTHQAEGDRCWTEQAAPSDLRSSRRQEAPSQKLSIGVPAVARIGNLDDAKALFGRRDYPNAWKAAAAALAARPFHPEAWLLLAEIALAAGDAASARQCAQRARDLAPNWKAPKQFLQKPLKGSAKLDWLGSAIRNPQSAIRNLSVCVIAKNEEQFLAQCLKSVKDVAAQLIVVDTGSTDRTIEIAKEQGAEVRHFEWCDDFGAARNAALEHATGDWILMLDADEELPADQHEALQADLKKTGALAFRLPLTNRGQEAEGQSFVPRLFRNVPGAFYRGRIHEQVFSSLLPACKSWGMDTALGTARLLHHGYTKEIVRSRQKIERNLRLLRLGLEERPEDINLLMNLGLELVRSGDMTNGIVRYREAFRLMSAQPPATVVPELREVLLTQFATHLYKLRDHDEIVRILTSPLAKNGGLTASLCFALGLSCFELKQYRDAAEHLRRCLGKRKEPALSPINTDILTAAPHHCLALSLAKLGDAAGAEKAFADALKEQGRLDVVKLDLARFLAEQNRPVDALHLLHEIVEENSQNPAAWRLGGEIALARADFLEFAHDWTSEAARSMPDDPVINAQRAEAMLLREEVAEARPLWERACNGTRPPRALAAFILCSAAVSQAIPPTRDAAEETAVSRAFIEWYQRLVKAGAEQTIVQLNSRMDALRGSIPTAARLLDSVLAEVKQSASKP